MADLMVIAAEAERTRSINPQSEMPFTESQTDIKAGARKIMHLSAFYLLLSFCHSASECVWVCGVRALQGSSRIGEHL